MIQHSLRVALRGRTQTIRQAGLAHDMVEDKLCTSEEVELIFGPRVCRIVMIVTRRKDQETYDQFIERICESGDTDAIEVKLNDNADNIERCSGMHEGKENFQFMYQRYVPAREKLLRALKQRSEMVYEAWMRANS